MFFDKYNDHPVWSSRWILSSEEQRVLSWRFGEDTESRSAFKAISVCVGSTLALIVLGLAGVEAAFVVVIFTAMLNLIVLGAVNSMVQTRECLMRYQSHFRFAQMQMGAPAFDLAVRYCMLASGDLREVSGTQWLVRGLHSGDEAVDLFVAKLLEESWEDDYRAVSAKGRARRARQRLHAVEQAVKRFGEIPSDAPEGFNEYCQAMIDEATQQYKAALVRKYERLQGKIQRDIARSQRDLMKVERRIAKLDASVGSLDARVGS